jgi:murein DD-endopeptidase MepM/ murein hydrolase activator NlpD
MERLDAAVAEGVRILERNPKISRRVLLAGAVAAGCATLTPSKEELAFYERLKSGPKGKRPLADFPEIIAGVGDQTILVDAYQHKPPIGIDYAVNPRFPWTPIVAPARGLVWLAEFNPENGYYVTIWHGFHYTGHGHLHPTLLVKKGDDVERGTLIGFGYNSGTNAQGKLHYHFSTAEPTFDPKANPSQLVVNPHKYAEKDGRLGTWNGNELDREYESQLRNGAHYVNYLMDRLPRQLSEQAPKALSIKLGILLDLAKKGILQKHITNEPVESIAARLQRIMDAKPTYTLFVNPKRLDLYHIISLA